MVLSRRPQMLGATGPQAPMLSRRLLCEISYVTASYLVSQFFKCVLILLRLIKYVSSKAKMKP